MGTKEITKLTDLIIALKGEYPKVFSQPTRKDLTRGVALKSEIAKAIKQKTKSGYKQWAQLRKEQEQMQKRIVDYSTMYDLKVTLKGADEVRDYIRKHLKEFVFQWKFVQYEYGYWENWQLKQHQGEAGERRTE